jgi:hypothetical protein
MISEEATIQTFEMQHGGGYTTYSVETLDRMKTAVIGEDETGVVRQRASERRRPISPKPRRSSRADCRRQ